MLLCANTVLRAHPPARAPSRTLRLRWTDAVLPLDHADPPRADFTIDLGHPNILLAIRGSFRTLSSHGNRVLRVLGPAATDQGETVEVLLDEAPLRGELWDFGIRILALSLVL